MSKQKLSARLSAFLPPLGGLLAMMIVMALFNSQYIAAQAILWLQPGNTNEQITVVDRAEPVTKEPVIKIPSINVSAPVVYDMPATDEPSVQEALEDGVLHFAGTPLPGEAGNSVFVGHSSNDVWAAGNYKFVFALLDRLEVGDEYYIHYDGVRYIYRVYEKAVVSPTDISVLNSKKASENTLITCTPIGTAISRLIIRSELIHPTEIKPASQSTTPTLQTLPGDN